MDRGEILAAPKNFEALRELILERRRELPKRLAQVAAFALDHPDEIAFGTAASIALAAEVQPSTLVRFSQAFGFDGFSALQAVFRERLRERNSSYEDRLAELESGELAPAGSAVILSSFIAAAHRSLDNLGTAIDPKRFESATITLASARTIHLIARRRSYPIATYMAYALSQLKIRCQIAGTASGIDDDLLAMADPGDAAFAISFSSYAPETIAQASALAARGIPVVSLTDSAFSPLAECSTVWFELVEADHAGFRSLSASMAFAMALAVGIAEERRRTQIS
ncbi:RpiR family transcriptional regulator [Devosia sp. Leaf64]|nr:RpiR family transcriptional regulator [Devosia sp. Leaf64]